ncbi:hypothetical protein TGAMA5MH_06285 [Trichoderma gamsii]|uniref:Isochorismatase n=1 Tax=Trichoderma gamsii TaxID=398673 RepID=A0A2K0T852_9HYPO|nr:hypothetical protein TGAMA5MH_06285 [Trichoderma gamsii]
MFAFDQAALPQITTRKALIVVDFQNEFIGDADPALPVNRPEGFVKRTAEIATAFRSVGDVIWIHSRFDKARSTDDDQIILSENPPASQPASSRNKGRPIVTEPSSDEPLDPEAFLSHEEPLHAKTSSDPGSNVPLAIEEAIHSKDLKLTKSYYSAFHGTQLLRALRGRMVTEVFICGSLANIGVYATAMEAAGHGMAITVIEDCCGYRHKSRQAAAIKNLIELTGCEILPSEEVLKTLAPSKSETKTPGEPTSAKRAKAVASTDEDIIQSLSGLKLDSSPSGPSSAVGKVNRAPKAKSESQEPKEATTEVEKENEKDQPVVGDGSTGRVADAENESDSSSQSKLCEGDTDVIYDALPKPLADEAFDKLEKEVLWQRMSHQGGEVPRLVAVQGQVDEDGTMPVYRHPADESPPLLSFSPTVQAIKAEIEKHLGHPLNHVLIQFYRDGNDYISEHSDKTLDIVKGSYIANVSLGAERTMILRTKRLERDLSGTAAAAAAAAAAISKEEKRKIQRARLPHNSLCRMGLQTNMKWLHAIRRDKRADRDKSAAELAFSGRRISLTFRHIGTFLDRDETIIWGQGATGRTRDTAHPISNGQSPEAVKMIQAFGTENHASDFDWSAHYGRGFDVLHISNSPRFFASADPIVNMRIALMLAEYGIKYAKGSMASGSESHNENQTNPPALWSLPIKFIDNDAAKSVIHGDMAIMLYLYSRYDPGRVTGSGAATRNPSELAKLFSQFQQGMKFFNLWRQLSGDGSTGTRAGALPVTLKQELAVWDSYIVDVSKNERVPFLCEDSLTLPDFVVWPILYSIVEEHGSEVAFKGLDGLQKYYEAVRQLDNVVTAVGNR